MVKIEPQILSRIEVSSDDSSTADLMISQVKPRLIGLLKHSDESQNKILSQLMKTVERAANATNADSLKDLVDEVYKFLEHRYSFEAFHLLFVIHSQSAIPSRFYQALFSYLFHPLNEKASKEKIFFQFISQVLFQEDNPVIVCSFVQRLLFVGIHQNPSFSISVLYLTINLLNSKPKVRSILNTIDPKIENTFSAESENFESDSSLACFPWIFTLYCQHYHPVVRELAVSILEGKYSEKRESDDDDFSLSSALSKIDIKYSEK